MSFKTGYFHHDRRAGEFTNWRRGSESKGVWSILGEVSYIIYIKMLDETGSRPSPSCDGKT